MSSQKNENNLLTFILFMGAGERRKAIKSSGKNGAFATRACRLDLRLSGRCYWNGFISLYAYILYFLYFSLHPLHWIIFWNKRNHALVVWQQRIFKKCLHFLGNNGNYHILYYYKYFCFCFCILTKKDFWVTFVPLECASENNCGF